MFSQSIVARATQYSESLLSNNQMLVPADVEMGKVIEAILFPLMNTRGVGVCDDNIETIAKFLSSECAHDNEGGFEKLSEAIAEAIGRNIKLVREVAIPLVNTTTTVVEHQIEAIEDSVRKQLSYDISENTVYELIVNDSTVNEIIKTAGNSTFDGYANGLGLLPSATLEQIIEMCRTGNSNFDDLLIGVFNNIGEKGIKATYTKVLSSSTSRHSFNLNDNERLAGYLMGFAVTSNMGKDNIPDGVDISLEEFTRRCLEYKSYCRYHLKVFVNDYRHKENCGNVVCDTVHTGDNSVKLNIIPSIYKQAVEQGITNEAIIGSTLSPTGSWNITSLLREKDNYVRLFEAKQKELLVQVNNKKIEVIVNAMRVAVNGIGKEAQVQFARLDWDKIRSVVSGRLRTRDHQSTADLMMEFVIDDLFQGTLVPLMIRSMNNYSKDMPEVRPEVLAHKMVIDITIRHLMGRFKLVPTSN